MMKKTAAGWVCVGLFWASNQTALFGQDKTVVATDAPPSSGTAAPVVEVVESAPSKPAPPPYGEPFFNNNFKYLEGVPNSDREYFEKLKQLQFGDNITVDVGGQFRHQFKSENRRYLLTGTPTPVAADAFQLLRTRIYADIWLQDRFRIYAEYIDAYSFNEDLPVLPIDENRSDLLNLFGDVRIVDWGDGTTVLRVGRQELNFGAGRQISSLDWSNTRRSWEGANLVTRRSEWELDLFWVRPTHVPPYTIYRPYSFDQADQSLWFGGFYGTYKACEDHKWSPYFFVFREEEAQAGPRQFARGSRHYSGVADNVLFTLGNRFWGNLNCNWLYDLEGAIQFGDSGNRDIIAGMVTAGLGRKFCDMTWDPEIWLYYDYASGDRNPNDNTVTTYHQLAQFAHRYFGFVDLVGRQNVHDINVLLTMSPSKKLKLLAWQHFFFLAAPQDGLYNTVGVVSFTDPTGNSGQHIGNELDLAATYKLNDAMDFEMGYGLFWSGNFLRNTAFESNAHLFYTQLRINF